MANLSDTHAGGIEIHEVVVVGAGMCGLYQLHRLLELGIDAVAIEAHDGLGGTWYKNRYPGCRFDSESASYGYSFSPEILAEWDWTERFSPQPETLRYLNFVARKLDLERHIQFNSRLASAEFNDDRNLWTLTLTSGRQLAARFILTAVGLLSIPAYPKFEGMAGFRGPSFHTYDWPAEGVDLKGKRVAVVGTGSSGVQVISAIASQVDSLTVFQRRPNWCAPLGNSTISDAEMDEIRAQYDEILAKCFASPSGFVHAPLRQKSHEVSRAERLALWERLYEEPGFGLWLGNYRDTLMNEEANAELSEFVAEKIRARIDDPAIAERLVPRDHGFGTRRVVLETGYYEVYNRDNVELIDVTETPIARVTPKGIDTSDRSFEFDVIVYATGFDAITGALDSIDIAGSSGQKLREKWADGPLTSFGMQIHGFPNLITLMGPQAGSAASNFPRGIEDAVAWTTDVLKFLRDHEYTRIEATAESEQEWLEHVREMSERMLLSKAKSWFTGYNPNVRDGNYQPRLLIYTGGNPRYREKLAQELADGLPHSLLS